MKVADLKYLQLKVINWLYGRKLNFLRKFSFKKYIITLSFLLIISFTLF